MNKPSKRIHLVNLFKWRSVVALIACILTIIFTTGSVVYGILTSPGETIKTEFEWFTVDSNLLTACAALMILPYTVEGIRKKRLMYPKWVHIIHYAGTICVSITHIFVLFFISWYDPELAFSEENLFLHIICPLAVIISFFMVEPSDHLSKKDVFFGLIPFFTYSVLYFYNVVISGAWEDHYKLNTFVPFYVSIPIVYVIAYVLAEIIRFIHNKILNYRERKLRAIWDEELDSVSVKIEISSLGFHSGLKQDKDDISIPFNILEEISKKFDIKLEELINAYTVGIINGVKEKSNTH